MLIHPVPFTYSHTLGVTVSLVLYCVKLARFVLLKVRLIYDCVCALGFKGRPWAVSRPGSTRREGKKSLCIRTPLLLA